MDATASTVGDHLAEASRHCNWRLLQRKARNIKNFSERLRSGGLGVHTTVVELAVLQCCPTAISKLLHQGGPCILAAKVFVMSRILLKTLPDKGSLKIISSLRDQLTAARSLLLRHIDQALKAASLDSQALIEALCSLSLVKTSPPADLLRHFLFIRSNAIASEIEPGSLDAIAMLEALRLFDCSLRVAEAIFPKKISEALLQLKSTPLFNDPEFRAIPDLNLHTNEKWLPEGIRSFTPWVRHDELDWNRIQEAVRTWAGRELETLYTSFERSLGDVNNVGILAGLRQELMALLKAGDSQLVRTIMDRENPRHRFRDLLNKRFGEVLEIRIKKLATLGDVAKKLMVLTESSGGATNLWAQSIVNMRISGGAAVLKSTVNAAIHGRGRSVKLFLVDYDQWSTSVLEGFAVIHSIRLHGKQSNELDDEDLDLDHDHGQESIEDAGKLEREALASIQGAYRELEGYFERILNEHEANSSGNLKDGTTRAIFLLRSIREIRRRPPTPVNATIGISWFGKTLIKRLQTIISQGTSIQTLLRFSEALKRRKWSCPNLSQALWEKTPPLPVQPSPLIFNLLHDLVKEMATVGVDIWTPAAVEILKDIVVAGVSDAFNNELTQRVLTNVEFPCKVADEMSEEMAAVDSDTGRSHEQATVETKVNEGADGGESSNAMLISRSWAIQSILDLLYLDRALRNKTLSKPTILLTHVTTIELLLGDSVERARLDANAQEYWTRTELLFSLLS